MWYMYSEKVHACLLCIMHDDDDDDDDETRWWNTLMSSLSSLSPLPNFHRVFTLHDQESSRHASMKWFIVTGGYSDFTCMSEPIIQSFIGNSIGTCTGEYIHAIRKITYLSARARQTQSIVYHHHPHGISDFPKIFLDCIVYRLWATTTC